MDRRLARRFTVASLLLFFVMAFTDLLLLPAFSGSHLPRSGEVAIVFDGDTVMLRSGAKVRYLGIDSPEVAHDDQRGDCYGEEAKRYNRRLVLGKRVRLEYDREKRDHYGRLLAYVYLPDGRCVNEELIKKGYAFVLRRPEGFKKLYHFLQLQRRAIQRRVGMWGYCRVDPEEFYIGNRRSFVFHRPSCPYGRQTARRNAIIFHSREEAFAEGFRPCRRCKP